MVTPTDNPVIDDEHEPLSHVDAMTYVQTKLTTLISNDILLSDLPREITLEEVKSQIALEYGQAMTVLVQRKDGQTLPIVVKQNDTVLDLKHSIQRHMMLKLSREGGPKHISWRYIWRRYCLCVDGVKLMDDDQPLKVYNIYNRSEVTFAKRLRDKRFDVT